MSDDGNEFAMRWAIQSRHFREPCDEKENVKYAIQNQIESDAKRGQPSQQPKHEVKRHRRQAAFGQNADQLPSRHLDLDHLLQEYDDTNEDLQEDHDVDSLASTSSSQLDVMLVLLEAKIEDLTIKLELGLAVLNSC